VTTATPAWLLPDEPAPVRLMNTIWADSGAIHDALTGPDALREWIAAVTGRDGGELGDPDAGEFNDARQLRDALRCLAALVTAGAPDAGAEVAEAIAVVNRLLADRPRGELALVDGGLRAVDVRHASPIRSMLAELAQQAVELFTGPMAVNLRSCNAPGCVLFFVKSHPRREWCSPGCGNRVRAARHYRRIRENR
jgi:predicted RNA-binding Zn ribbon-like protein